MRPAKIRLFSMLRAIIRAAEIWPGLVEALAETSRKDANAIHRFIKSVT